jgi:hypothetical protein
MAKQKGKQRADREQQARGKLEQSREKLQAAQDDYGRIMAAGEQALQRVRERWDARALKAKRRVERRYARVQSAESRLLEPTTSPPSPEATADVVEEAEARSAESRPADDVISVAGTDDMHVPGPENADQALPSNAERALQVLRQMFSAEGATPGQWRAACEMPERTFMRARKTLVDRGLVARDGKVGRDARYLLTESGRSLGIRPQGSE